jgi:hypothetical protein
MSLLYTNGSDEMIQSKGKTRITGKKFLSFLIITDLIAWAIIVIQDHIVIGGVLQNLPWLVWILIVIIGLAIGVGVFLYVFKTEDRHGQLIRSIPLVLLLIASLVGLLIFKGIADASSITPDITITIINDFITGLIVLFAFLTLIAAALVFARPPKSQQYPLIINFTRDGDDSVFADWIKGKLSIEYDTLALEPCDGCSARDVFRKIRRHVAQRTHLILLLSPGHPLMQRFNMRCKLWLLWMQLYYRNMRGRGAFILVFTRECPEARQKALRFFHPIDYYRNDQQGQQELLDRIRSLQEAK